MKKTINDKHEPCRYAYARVSTTLQTTDTQYEAFLRAGLDPAYIVTETASGRKRRVKLEALMSEIQSGDELHITKLDRLGRNARELHNTASRLTEQGVILVIGGTVYKPNDPMSKMLFGLTAIFAEFEADQISERTELRLRSIQEAGGVVGRKRATTPEQEDLILDLRDRGYSNSEIRKVSGIGNSALYRIFEDARAVEEEAADPSITRARRAIQSKTAKNRDKTLKAAADKYAALAPKDDQPTD